MGLLEAEVHETLKDWLRQHSTPDWPHHLTMGRLVSRALRMRRSALIQTGTLPTRYSVSYLLPALFSEQPVQIVVTPERLKILINTEIPALQTWLKDYCNGDRYENCEQKLSLITPSQWLENINTLPTLIEQADYLEDWTRNYFSQKLTVEDWQYFQSNFPNLEEAIRNTRIQLIKTLFSHPPNPYDYYLLTVEEQHILENLLLPLVKQDLLTKNFKQFWLAWRSQIDNVLIWAKLDRNTGQFTISVSPVNLNKLLTPYWQQTFVIMGGFLDADKQALTFRKAIGVGDLLCLKFTPNRQTESIQIYLPEGLPLPNTPQFKGVLFGEIQRLIRASLGFQLTIVILLEDLPLKIPLATLLAAEFGARVQVEKMGLKSGYILISSWEFWCNHQSQLPLPHLLILGTLPLPSLEHPLVASRVSYHKHHHQDWFRSYLLPTALKSMQQAVLPLRENQGAIAIFDHRV
ncbi:MAG: ATP-dependent DNA helicase, partial [Microcystaceae cyanobacterium]